MYILTADTTFIVTRHCKLVKLDCYALWTSNS